MVKNKTQSTGFRDSYIDFITTMFNCEIFAMNAENKQREFDGKSLAYTEDDYTSVMEKYEKLYCEYIKSLNNYKRKIK